MIALWLAAVVAAAQGCEDVPAVDEAAAELRAALRSAQPQAATIDAAIDAVRAAAACADAPVDDRVWAGVLLDLTIVRFQLGRDWRAPRTAAAWARPDLPVEVGPALAELRDWTPPAPSDAQPLPFGRTVWLDGRPRADLPVLEGLHLVQGTRCDAWTSDLVEGDAAAAARARWAAACAAPAWSRRDLALVATGAGLTVAGIVAAVVTYALAQPATEGLVPRLDDAPLTVQERDLLRGGNAAGWAASSVGVGLVVTGAVLRAQQVRRARRRP